MHSQNAPKQALTLAELASLTQCQLVGDEEHRITGVADLDNATGQDASFLANPRYANAMRKSRAGVIFVTGQTPLLDGGNYLRSDDPSRAFQIAAEALIGHTVAPITRFSDSIHPSAVIHESAQLGSGVSVGPNAVIDGGVVIGDRSTIGAGVVIGPDSSIGQDTLIHSGVLIREGSQIGDRVILQPGVVIGGCGFGYTQDSDRRHHKLQHLSYVVIEDDVEIGANTAIDRGRLTPTRIKRGTKIDNLVQIGHNVVVGEDNIIVGQTGLAGSARTGSRVMIGGQVAVNGHIEVADDVLIAATSGVVRSLTKPGRYGGAPAEPMSDFMRRTVMLGKIEQHVQRINELEQRIAQLESPSEVHGE